MRYKIPLSAIKVEEIRGIIKDGEHKDKELTVSLYEGEASQGAQSGFSRVPHLWIRISGGGWIKPEIKRFSGKNIVIAQAQLLKLKEQLIMEEE